MPEQGKRIFWTVEGPTFDMRSLIRLGIWGGLATLAMGVAVISAYSATGSQRPASQAGQQSAAITSEVSVQSAQTAADVRRLSEAVRGLMVDRDQLLNRISSLEHGLDDVTGSLKRDAAASAPQATVTSTPPVVSIPAVTTPKQDAAGTPTPASVTTEVAPQSQPVVAARAAETEADALVASSGLGVDVGGAVNFEGLRTLWLSTRRNNPDLSDDIYPIVAVRENSKNHNVDLRLVIGPVASSEAAARVCVALLAAHHYCQTVAFEGQRLSLAEPAKPGVAAAHRLIPANGP